MLGRALAARAPGAACPGPGQAALLDCAEASYAAAVAVQASSVQGSAALHGGLAQALLCRAELDPPDLAAGRANQAAAAARLGPNAAFHGAWAALIAARPNGRPNAGSDAERCAAVRRAATLAIAAEPPARARLLADAEAQRGTIPGCEAPR